MVIVKIQLLNLVCLIVLNSFEEITENRLAGIENCPNES